MDDWQKSQDEDKEETPGAKGGEGMDPAGTPSGEGEAEATGEETKEEGAVGGDTGGEGGTPAWGAPEKPKADEPDKPAE